MGIAGVGESALREASMRHSFADRLFVAAVRRGTLDTFVLPAVRKAASLFGLMVAYRIVDLRKSDDPLLAAESRIEEQDVLLNLSNETAEILAQRWEGIPMRRRPHYKPEVRFRILRVKHILGL